jgi:hypothetical protein
MLNDVELKERHIKFSDRFAALENLDDDVDMIRA